jgi:hypothetical protein
LEGKVAKTLSTSLSQKPKKPAEVNKAWFDSAVAKLCRNLKGAALVSMLEQAIRGAVELMGVMAITVIDPHPALAQQVYLWYQEKTLLGDGTLLLNPCPGVTFTAGDLARNLVLAPLISLGSSHMDCMMREHWLPLEKRFQSPSHFDSFLTDFVRKPPVAPPSPAVKELMEHLKICTKDGLEGIKLYLQFVSTYDRIVSSIRDELRGGELAALSMECSMPSDLDGEARVAYCETLHVIDALRTFANSEGSALKRPQPCAQETYSQFPQKRRFPPLPELA